MFQRARVQRVRRSEEHPESETTVRRRITVGAADDRLEHEADDTAARVLANLAAAESAPPNLTVDPSTRVRRMAARTDAPQATSGSSPTRVQRMAVRTSAPQATSGSSPTRVQRRSDVGGIGPAGGEIDGDTQARLDRTSGRGAALDPEIRRSMEQGFGGADFGNVRLHTGGEAAELNQRLGAQAFTLGSDIYLGGGTPALDSRAGQGLLAHELAHTVQQEGSAQRRIRRLAYNKPIKNVVSIKVFAGGAGGRTAEVSDGKKAVIVKSGQVNAAEVIAADKMMRGGRFKSGKYKIKAPKSRLAGAADIAELKAKVNAPGVLQGAPREFVTGLDGKPTIIAEPMEGETLDAQMKAAVTKTTTTGDDGKAKNTSTRDDDAVKAIKKLVSSSAPIKAVAKATGIDVGMGNGDRFLTQFAPENFLFDAKTKRFKFVDNTAKDTKGSLVSKADQGTYVNARGTFNAWVSWPYVDQLISDPDALTSRLVTMYTGLKPDGMQGFGGNGIIAPFLIAGTIGRADNDKNNVARELKALIMANYPSMVAAATAGLKQGRDTLLKQLADPLSLTAGLPQDIRLEAVTSLIARRAVLKGAGSADAAWDSANEQAHKLLKMKFKPATPAFDSEQMARTVPNFKTLLT